MWPVTWSMVDITQGSKTNPPNKETNSKISTGSKDVGKEDIRDCARRTTTEWMMEFEHSHVEKVSSGPLNETAAMQRLKRNYFRVMLWGPWETGLLL